MSKDQKKNEKEYVEIVEKLSHFLSWISSTLVFFKMDTIFPVNMIKKACDDFYLEIENLLYPIEERPF